MLIKTQEETEVFMRDFHYLDVWHKAHALTLSAHQATEAFPKIETFGLSTTLRRSTSHLTMKIAEACGRDIHAEFLQCLSQARAMGVEIEYQFLLAKDLGFLTDDLHTNFKDRIIEVRRMLSGLIKTASV